MVSAVECDGDSTTTDDMCHDGVCESVTYTTVSSKKCATFLPYDSSLVTLQLAEAQCAAGPDAVATACGAVFSDGGFWLCDGRDTVDAVESYSPIQIGAMHLQNDHAGVPGVDFTAYTDTDEAACQAACDAEPRCRAIEVRSGDPLHDMGDDSCQYSADGVCDVPQYCNAGTDATDCGGALCTPRPWIADV
jgi:hypothetical protein